MGIHLLQNLLRNRFITKIYCLVKGENYEKCVERVKKIAQKFSICSDCEKNGFNEKVEVKIYYFEYF